MQDLRRLDAHIRSAVRNALEVHLRFEPTKVSRSRIKRLIGLTQPQYRLRVGEIRVFYDVTEEKVEILAILYKPMVKQWLKQAGRPS
jgi:mRNA interferase RelE/StbE